MTTASHIVRRTLLFLSALPLAAVTLTGCGVDSVTQSATGTLGLSGHVHGGAQPVSGATVELYSVGRNGNGSQAINILTRPVTTDSNSYFSIASDYTCTSTDEQVYLVARGGNPGFSTPVDNKALVLLSALGSCTNLINNPNTTVWMNEVSTVAAVYALAPFMSAYDHTGASATNTAGITNAMLNAQLLSNVGNGEAASLASTLSVEQAKLYALADAIVPCVNSVGGNACTPLFTVATPPGGAVPTDVVGALLNIVRHPGNNVEGVFDLITPAPPYPATLTEAPSDWTMSLTVTGGGLYEPTALGVDASGNIWAANFGGPMPTGGNYPTGVVAYSPQGIPFNGTPFGPASMTEVYGLALDATGNAWITSEENISHDGTTGSIGKILGAGSSTPGAFLGPFSDDTLDYPESIASDPGSGTILVGNFAGSTITTYDLNGNFVRNAGAGSLVFPNSVTSDGAGGSWVANQGEFTITHLPATGSPQVIKCCSEPNTVALDPGGNVWVTNFGQTGGEYTISELSSSGAIVLQDQPVAGLSTPGGAVVDAGGQFWVLNYHSGSFIGVAGNSNSSPVGTALSPIVLGEDANLIEPYAIAADPSGNLWVSNRGMNSLVMFFGLATPTASPSAARPLAP